jgi:hypothetical protein
MKPEYRKWLGSKWQSAFSKKIYEIISINNDGYMSSAEGMFGDVRSIQIYINGGWKVTLKAQKPTVVIYGTK